ncbi:G-type lectin S-receptor-like serine/threonine-protein kinase LECRK4 [Arachis ipaensis]|uniref:G-type lectin S-receptor-like serine/threonine-protein kinase LECRK4 n=1 Tax=Arachis ipaensis TaxID=130454 RepID=UPI0007AF9414|nr:G-type lectin S-receptor-like serine/threonine-protein kinase LECRK4 [Arachis ipaensis]
MASATFFMASLLFLHMTLAFANITINSTLSTTNNNNAWRSPSGEFAFGFHQLKDTNLFIVAIWYDKIPEKTIVWSSYSLSNPTPTGSKIQLTPTGLKLTTPNGESTWIAQTNNPLSHGSMLDTGNFVLASSDNKKLLWQSFKNPTDTLLPNQTLESDATLTSRLTDTNYTRGRFQFYFQNDTIMLSPLAWPTEFRYDNYDVFGHAARLVFDESGEIYLETENGNRTTPQAPKWQPNLALDPRNNYYRATLDYFGVLTQYVHPKDSNSQQGWRVLRYTPSNICTSIFNDYGSGACGYNSYCSMEEQRPTCNCPDGYTLIDPSNVFGGCQPNFTLGGCGADNYGEELQARPEDLYNFSVLSDVDFPLNDYEQIQPYSQDECQQDCLHDCNCAVAIYTNNQTCWKKRLPLSNGRAQSGGQTILIKTRVAPLGIPTGAESKKDHNKIKPGFHGLLIGSLVINVVLLAAVLLAFHLKKRKRDIKVSSLLETNLHSFSYEALNVATREFSEELGRGSFGIVYKGTIESRFYNVVAVKKLDRLAQEGEKEFKAELSAIGKTCHKNLVRLIGFCDEGTNRMLVYEFMSKGALANFLFGQTKPIWDLRVRFALGIARGLVYLHEECDTPIIHCDIKPQNILIDDNFNAKISDFGLAKLLLSDQSRTNTMIRGTRGYVAPEWFRNVPVTVKVDVYSFGVMLLEIICCRRSVLMLESGEEEKAVLTDWAYDCFVERRIDALVDDDTEAIADSGRLQRWVKIAIWCIQEHHEMRPTMGIVLQMLEGLVEVSNPPSPFSLNPVSSLPHSQEP